MSRCGVPGFLVDDGSHDGLLGCDRRLYEYLGQAGVLGCGMELSRLLLLSVLPPVGPLAQEKSPHTTATRHNTLHGKKEILI